MVKVIGKTFASLDVTKNEDGTSTVTLSTLGESLDAQLSPTELGIFLTKLGNAMAEGMETEVVRAQERILMYDKRRIN